MTRHSGVIGGEDAAWRPPAQTGTTTTESLAGYDHLTEVGRGGDSVVFRARDVAMNRDVAVKVLQTDDERAAARFVREIEITVALGRQHPNIVNILTTGTTESGHPAIVMDFYESGSLDDRLRSHGPLPVDEVVTIGAVLADALAFAHSHGVLHRDVKPQNVLVLPTSWVLADFGIARLVDSEHTSSVETFTYRHASPQILDGQPPTAADDLWSLGSTLYTLVDGRPPFASDDPDDDSALAYLRRARTEPHRALSGTDAGALAAVVDRCLAKDPERRWQSAAELRDALSRLRVTAWEPGAARSPLASAPAAAPAEAPPPVAPDPVALSVLAHAPRPVVDESPTGLRPVEPTSDPAPSLQHREPAPPAAPSTERPHHGRRWLLLGLGGAALLIGLVLGIVGAVLRSDGDAPPIETPAADLGAPVPSLSSAPTESGEAQLRRADPRLAFDFLKLRSDGTSLALKWNDPSDGEGDFVLSQTSPEEVPEFEFRAGTTEATVPFVIPDHSRACFVMTVHLPTGEIGITDSRCVTR
ncbi:MULTISPECIES: serine/threonine-protein kinase [unclassified Nocardioides]|uniref:serine/threonine-protein kinase n=1 Tax=unclassified Nocardioides TaxID=2615069 RepID=UPI0009F0AC66|nr:MULTISPECIES: serine/threonine-protein kinase [unclassified Nocardioides]GAW47806.1 Serine/threonine protein kinase [Nocardioides sp. PD653-B2]GAW53560.1 Serine/threonine protein kinase [Nocardioides sp. PD653]